MITLLGIVVAWSAAIFGYGKARGFVRDRLRYVESVHKPIVPFKFGFLAMLATLPVAWVMPVITTGSALLFGAAVGMGVAAGRKDIRTRRYLSA
jgi:hypothetical protein